MSGVEDILAYAWNKDAVNLASALDGEMSARAADAISNMTASVAAQMFGQEVPVVEEQPEVDNVEPQDDTQIEQLPDQQVEEPADEQNDQ